MIEIEIKFGEFYESRSGFATVTNLVDSVALYAIHYISAEFSLHTDTLEYIFGTVLCESIHPFPVTFISFMIYDYLINKLRVITNGLFIR